MVGSLWPDILNQAPHSRDYYFVKRPECPSQTLPLSSGECLMKNHIPSFCVFCIIFFFSAVSASQYASLGKNTVISISKDASRGLAKAAASDTIMNVKDIVYNGSDSLIEVFSYSFDQKLRPFMRSGYRTFGRFEYDNRDLPVKTAICGPVLLQWLITAYDTVTYRKIMDSYYYCPSQTPYSTLTSSRYNYDSLTGRIIKEDCYNQYGITFSLNYLYDQSGNLVKVYAPGLERVELVYGPVAKPEPVTPRTMEGDWQSSVPEYGCSSILLSGCSSRYTFFGDSFYCKQACFNDVSIPTDTCGSAFEWELFVRGAFSINQDSISLHGFYTDSNFNLRNTGCTYGYRLSGPYDQTYQYQLCGNTMILFDRKYQYPPNPVSIIWMQKTAATPTRYAALSSPRPTERIVETGYYTVSGRRLSFTLAQRRTYRGVVIMVQRTATGKTELKRGFGEFR
jgi:hypothetical protein